MGVKTIGSAVALVAAFAVPSLAEDCKTPVESNWDVDVEELANDLNIRPISQWETDFPKLHSLDAETLTNVSEEIKSEDRIERLTKSTLSTLNDLYDDLEDGKTIQWEGEDGVYNNVAFAVWGKLQFVEAISDLQASDVAYAFQDVKGDITAYAEFAADRLLEIRDMPVCDVEAKPGVTTKPAAPGLSV